MDENEIYETESIDQEFGYICDNCGDTGETDGSNKCPKCGIVLWTGYICPICEDYGNSKDHKTCNKCGHVLWDINGDPY